MAIKLSTPARVQAFLMGYGQKEARIPAIWNTIKALAGGGKKLVDSGVKGVGTGAKKGWQYAYDSPWLSYGAPAGVGGGLGAYTYAKDENPDKSVLTHGARAVSTAFSLSPKYQKALWNMGKSKQLPDGSWTNPDPMRGIRS